MDSPPPSSPPPPSSSSTKKKEKGSGTAGSGSGTAGSGASATTANLPVFPVGPAGKRELKRALVKSTDPAKTISTFQQRHSLHSMVARAFGTTPSYEYRATRKNSTVMNATTAAAAAAAASGAAASAAAPARKTVETLDTDSVMTFLSHLGVWQHEVHKRISDTLMKALVDEIRKSGASGSGNNSGGGSGVGGSAHRDRLLDLLKSCWMYATTIPELRPVLWAVLRQLGEVCTCAANSEDQRGCVGTFFEDS
jgi:hypothetical protein